MRWLCPHHHSICAQTSALKLYTTKLSKVYNLFYTIYLRDNRGVYNLTFKNLFLYTVILNENC